jgi:UPF0042 nucleotide-binding protein
MSSSVIVITGMSGAGKSSAIDVLEDFGFFCMDNVPPSLVDQLVNIVVENDVEKSAFVVDIRTVKLFGGIERILKSLIELKSRGLSIISIFLDAEDDVLYYRYQKTRRAHPLQQEEPLELAIAKERAIMNPLKEKSDYIIDTSNMDMKEMKESIVKVIRDRNYKIPPMRVEIESFSYNRGVPHDANLLFDVRFLPNPYYYEKLIDLTGLDLEIKEYIEGYPGLDEYFDALLDLCKITINGFAGSGRNLVKIAVGCTGGKHRSVYIAERLFETLKSSGLRLSIDHREQKIRRNS